MSKLAIDSTQCKVDDSNIHSGMKRKETETLSLWKLLLRKARKSSLSTKMQMEVTKERKKVQCANRGR